MEKYACPIPLPICRPDLSSLAGSFPALHSLSIVLVLLAFSLLPAFGQSTGGRIIGRVVDPTGAVIADVSVRLTNESTGMVRMARTNDNGDYVLLEVTPGTYSLEFEHIGFKRGTQRAVSVDVNQVVTLNLTLQVGGADETVEVRSDALQVELSSTQMGAVLNQRAVSQLPLNARDTYQLLQLQPGVQSQTGSDLFYGSDRAGVVSVNGGRGRANNFSVNGGDANDQFVNLPAIQPTPDSIEEFRVLTNTFDAEYGRNSGAVVNVVTKSGGNEFHGNVYEFFRNKVLNARGYFDTQTPAFLQNQFGGTFGGPIKKEKTFFFTSYEGRRIRQGIPSDSIAVPSAQERPGSSQPFADFSDGSAFQGAITTDYFAQLLNQRSGCADAIGASIPMPSSQSDGKVLYSSIFPGNQIPAPCMDATAVDLLGQFVPFSNRPDGTYQTAAGTHRDRTDQFTIKLDHHLSNKQNLSFYYYFTDSNLFDPFARFQSGGANLLDFGTGTLERFQQWNLSHSWTIGDSLLNEARFTYFREGQGTFLHPQRTNTVQNSCATVASAACFDDGTPGNPTGIHPGLGASHEGVPFITIAGGFSIGNNFEGELPQVGHTLQWSDNLSWINGAHTLKFGADIRRQRLDQTLYYNVNGTFSYFGGGPNDVAFDNLYPNYLLGLPDTYTQGSAQSEHVRSTFLALFAQDSWKVRPSLTLNYGLRWELFSPLTDVSAHVQTFRPTQVSSVYPCQLSDASVSFFQQYGVEDPNCDNTGVVPTGLVVPGDRGVPPGLTSTYYKTFAPRIGIAYSPFKSGKTSIRAGWGMFYNPIEQLVLAEFSGEPPFGGSNIINYSLFNTPFQDQLGDPAKPNPFHGIINSPRNKPVDWSQYRPILLYGQFQPHLRTQYSAQYNLNIQHQLAKDLLLQVGYVGSQGHRLLASRDFNYGNAQTCIDLNSILGDGTCAQFGADSTYFIPTSIDGVPTVAPPPGLHLPYNPGGTTLIPAGTPIGSVAPNGITLVGLRQYSSPQCHPLTGEGCPPDSTPVFSSIFAEDTIANSNYNSLQSLLEKRFSKQMQMQLAYTWSKSFDYASSFEGELDPLNYRRTYSLSQFDARHRIVLSYYWELPIPKFNGFTAKVLNGWDVSGIYTYQTGFPIRVTSSADNELMNSSFFEYPGEPDQIAPFRLQNPKANGGYWFDPSSFTEDTTADPSLFGRVGNAKRTICCGPPVNNFDFVLHKVTPLTEKSRIELRAEFFNLFNHTQFFNPDGNSTDGTDFGRIKRAKDPRLMQLAVKIFF